MAVMRSRNDLDTREVSRNDTWDEHEAWWRENFRERPYVTADCEYGRYRGAYRHGFECANDTRGSTWGDAERKLRTSWPTSPHRGADGPAWDEVKDAVRDGWERLTAALNPHRDRASDRR